MIETSKEVEVAANRRKSASYFVDVERKRSGGQKGIIYVGRNGP